MLADALGGFTRLAVIASPYSTEVLSGLDE